MRRLRMIVTLVASSLGGASAAQELCDLSDQLMLNPDGSQAPRAVAFGDGLVFLVASGVLTVVDDSTLAVRSTTSLPTTGSVRGALLREGLLYISASTDRLWTVDPSDPDNPLVISDIAVDEGTVISAGAGLVVVGGGSISTVDLSDPAQPTVAGWASVPVGFPAQAAAKGGAVYVANRYGGLWIFDVSNPAHVYLRQVFLALSADGDYRHSVRSVDVDGDRAFISVYDAQEVWTLDVSRQFLPVRTSVHPVGTRFERLQATPGRLFAGDGGAVTVFSTADPAQPAVVGEIPGSFSTRFWASDSLLIGGLVSETVVVGIDRCDEPCPADLAAPLGELNFFDVSAFLALFGVQDDAADFAEPFGQWDFFDVSAYLSAFNAGCSE